MVKPRVEVVVLAGGVVHRTILPMFPAFGGPMVLIQSSTELPAGPSLPKSRPQDRYDMQGTHTHIYRHTQTNTHTHEPAVVKRDRCGADGIIRWVPNSNSQTLHAGASPLTRRAMMTVSGGDPAMKLPLSETPFPWTDVAAAVNLRAQEADVRR